MQNTFLSYIHIEAVEEQCKEESITWTKSFAATLSDKLNFYKKSVAYGLACNAAQVEYQMALDQVNH